MKKWFDKPFNGLLVAVIISFVLQLKYYTWWIALLNSIAIITVAFVLSIPVKRINRNRKRYFPGWLPTLISTCSFLIMFNLRSYLSIMEIIWILTFVAFLLSIIFPEKPDN